MADNKLTYSAIKARIQSATIELVPGFPANGTIESWESYIEELENLDIYELAQTEVESWDWSIYTHYGIKILDTMSNREICDAESEWHEMQGGELSESLGVYEMASQVAYFYLVSQLRESVESMQGELIELAQTAIENQ